MTRLDRFVGFLYKTRSRYGLLKRRMFPSPAELRLIELLGGKVLRSKHIKSWRRKFPLAIVVSMGPYLRRQKMKREVRYGAYYVDFANDLHRIIEVDGRQYHQDVVADLEREMDIKGRWTEARFLRIPAWQIKSQPDKVVAQVHAFLD